MYFRQAVEQRGGRLYTLPIDAKGPAGEQLTIDIGWFGAEHPKSILLHSSGVHGVEAFAGSAVQLELLDSLSKPLDDMAFVFIHVMNPYGMAWLRRFNENNVDLNRNFLAPGEKYKGAPENYRKLDSLLNPKSPPSFDFFLPRAGFAIARYGFNSLKQAIGGGQYEYPKGIMFGGKELQQGPAKLQAFLAPRLIDAEKVFAIDVHTGLGKYGEDTFLSEPIGYARVKQMFGERVAPLDAESGPAYRTTGSIDNGVRRAAPKATLYFICQEFGTYGPLTNLQVLRDENRWHHYGSGALSHPSKKKLKDTFYPDDDSWRLKILQRGRDLFNQALGVLARNSAP